MGTYYIAYNLQDSSYTDILRSTDVATITVTESTTEASEEITTGTLSCDFMRGMDLSTFYTNWTNGAVYYDYEGTEYSQSKGNAVDFFKFLYKDCGVNWVRLRVWNGPYDEDGNPYGGGNNDVATAAIIGKWASDAGMTVLIDFHYSDFWADPGRQLAPKAWADMTIDEKVDALYTYTYDSLEYLLDAGVNVGMVQVGNETNGSLCGEKITTWSDYDTNEGWQNMVSLFKSGSKAVRDISDEYDTNIKVALHFTNPNNNNPSWYCGLLVDAVVDFDAIGISYYMYWHGTLSNLANEINTINNTYGKEAFIAETAYPYSSENYDNLGNQITSFDDFDMNANLYAISEKGQEAALTAILSTLSGTNCTGLFYWEAAWTTIDSDDYRDAGGGWATKWASDYISYSMSASEGSSFDNQALFNNDDKALPALKYYVDFVEGTENLPEHNYELDEDASTAATCTEDGENVYVCTVCGDSYTETVSATGHSYGTPDFSWSDDHSTCTATFTCENDNSHVTTVDCTVNSETTAAACTEEGKTVYTATCTFNGAEYADEQTVEIDATGHTEADAVTENEVAATCTEAGSYDEVVYCSVCKAELSRETVTVPATGHSYEATEVVAPTYAAQGYTVYTCPDCGDSYRADYTDVLVLDEADEGLNIRQKVEDLTTLPEGLAHLYADVEELRAALISQVTVKAGYTEDNTAVYDVTLQYRVDGGAWADATEDNFPLSGVTVTLPYPDGTDSSYDFVVLHMFTVTSERLGTAAGQTEFPTVTKTEDGLVVTLTGLSPVAIAWKEPDETTSVSSSTTTTTSSSSVSSSSSTDSSSSTSSSSASSPKTGDEAQPMLWMALFLIACGGLAAVVIYLRRKQD